MAELHWFPLYFEDWLTSRSITAMLPEQEGAYIRLLMHAWGDGSHEPWLEANDAKLAAWSRLGSRWRKLGSAIVAEFAERDGKLYNERLSAIWQEQQEKHASAVVKARKAVATREDNKKKRRAAVDATRQHPGDDPQDQPGDHLQDDSGDQPRDDLGSKQSELDVVVEPVPNGTGVLPSTAPSGALAPNAPRAHGAGFVAGSIPGSAPIGRAELDARGRAIDKAYAEGLQRAALEWKLLHGDEYAALEKAECATRAIAAPPIAGGRQREFFDAAVIERVRAHLNWPTRDVWVEEKTRLGKLDALIRGAA